MILAIIFYYFEIDTESKKLPVEIKKNICE